MRDESAETLMQKKHRTKQRKCHRLTFLYFPTPRLSKLPWRFPETCARHEGICGANGRP